MHYRKSIYIIFTMLVLTTGCSQTSVERGLASNDADLESYSCIVSVNGDDIRSVIVFDGNSVDGTLSYNVEKAFPPLEDTVVFEVRVMEHEIDEVKKKYVTLVKVKNDEVVKSVPVVGDESAWLYDEVFWTELGCKRRDK